MNFNTEHQGSLVEREPDWPLAQVFGRATGARAYSIVVGLILLVVGVLRLVPGASDLVVSLLNVNMAVAYLNIVVGLAGILAWMASRRDVVVRT